MNLSLSEDQVLLQEAAARIVEGMPEAHTRRSLDKHEVGFGHKEWTQLVENGWVSHRLAIDIGGAGMSAVESMVLLRELGRGLLLEPLIPTAVLSSVLVETLGSEEQRSNFAKAIDAGQVATVAMLEPGGRNDLHFVQTRADVDGDSFVLNGRKTMVWHGPAARTFLVSAKTDDASDELTLFLIEADAEGLDRYDVVTADAGRMSELRLTDVRVPSSARLAQAPLSHEVLERFTDEAIVALGAEALGAMQTLQAITLDYVKTRKQFGQTVGSFQAVQHRLADMFIACEEVQSLLIRAAIEVAAGGPEASLAASALKVKVGQAGRFIGQNAVQLHGGMGMTDELTVGLYFKRLTAIDAQFGNTADHLQRYSRLRTP
jgi:alkylation response protein AidB-like acyl-CoA dehydrogenase